MTPSAAARARGAEHLALLPLGAAWPPSGNPTPWVTLTTTHRSNLFNPTDPLSFTLSAAGIAATYDVVASGTNKVVASGPVSGSALTIPGALPYGHYRLRLYGGATGAGVGATNFVVLCPAPHLPANPAPSTPGIPYDDAYNGLDNVVRGVMDVSTLRWSYDPRTEHNGSASLTAAQLAADIAHDMQWWGSVQDPARPRSILVELPNGSYDMLHMKDTSGGANGPQVYLASTTVDPTTTWVSTDASGNLIVSTGTSATALTQQESWPITAPTADGEMRLLNTFASKYIRAFCQHQGFKAPAPSQAPVTLAEKPGVNLHALITAMATKAYAAGCTRFEGPWNEPTGNGDGTMGNPWGGGGNVHGAQEQEACHAQALLQQAVLAGAPNALAAGPGTVSASWPPNTSLDTGLDIQLAWLVSESRTDIFAEVTQHAYNTFNGDPWVAEKAWGQFAQILANRGWGSRPRWMTEMGEFASVYGVLHMRRQLSWGLRRTFMQEAVAGIPPERSSWFYPTSHGFWDYPSFWRCADGSLFAIAAGRRAMSAAMWGKVFDKALPASSSARAYHYTEGASSGAGDLLVLFTAGSPSMTATVTSSAAGTVLDVFGNQVATLTAGSNQVAISDLPTYVLVPKGTTVAVADVNRLLTATPVAGGTDTTSGTATNLAQVQAGPTNPYLWGGGGPAPWTDTSGALPCSFTRTYSSPQGMNGLAFSSLPGWQSWSAPTAFTVDALVGGAWLTQFTYTNPTAASDAFADGSNGTGCTRESRWDEAYAFDCPFPAVVAASAVRVTVTALSYGGEPDLASAQAGGQGTTTPKFTLNTFTPYLTQGASMADQYTFVAPPAVTSVTPTSGPTAGGTSVTVAGTGFTGATAVKFGTVAATSFTVVSDTSLTAVAPTEAAGTVAITVTTPAGTSTP